MPDSAQYFFVWKRKVCNMGQSLCCGSNLGELSKSVLLFFILFRKESTNFLARLINVGRKSVLGTSVPNLKTRKPQLRILFIYMHKTLVYTIYLNIIYRSVKVTYKNPIKIYKIYL